MKKEELDILLEKYYSGTATENEEDVLKSYFLSADILPGYETEAGIFSYMNEISSVPEPSPDLAGRIIFALDSIRKENKINKIRRSYNALSGIAAGILIIIASWFFLVRSTEPADTYDDPEIAYAAAVSILYEVSGKLKQGLNTIEPFTRLNTGDLQIIGELHKSVDLAGKELQSLNHLNRVIEMTSHSDEQ